MTEPSVLQVFVFRAGGYVGSEVFADAEITIGSSADADLVLEDPAVAPAQAILAFHDGQATLLDLGTGTTRVNHTPIEHCYVTARDEIQLGGHTLKIKPVVTKKSTRPQPASVSEVPVARAPEASAARPAASASVAPTKKAPATSRQAHVRTDLVRAPDAHEVVQAELQRDLQNLTNSIAISGSDVLSARPVTTLEKALAPEEVPIPAARAQRAASLAQPALLHLFEDAGAEDVSLALDSAFGDPEPTKRIEAATPLGASHPVFDTVEPTRRLEAEPLRISEPTRRLEAQPASPVVAVPVVATPVVAAPIVAAPTFDGAIIDDDDEVDDEDLRPGYRLLDAMGSTSPTSAADAALEIVEHVRGEVRGTLLLERTGDAYVLGQSFRRHRIAEAGHRGLRLVRWNRDGWVLEFPISAKGELLRQGERLHLDRVKVPENAVKKKGDRFAVTLGWADQARVELGDHGFWVRMVTKPKPLLNQERFRIDSILLKAGVSAVVVHFFVFLLWAILLPGISYSNDTYEQWAEIREDQLRPVELPPEPEPPPPEPEPEPEPEAETAPEPPPREAPAPLPAKARKPGPAKGVPKQEVQSAGVLGAMGKLNLAAPGKKSLVQAVSNVDAVQAPGGSNFRVGALVGKPPTSDVNLGAGGGGAPLTRGGAALLRGGPGFAAIGKREGSEVRGTVDKVKANRVEAKGSISREEIARVINEHLSEVQACYEKALIKEPGITGKLVVEWVIETNGSVGRVKQQISTLRTPEVASCIMGRLKRWNFPRPKGGIVVVSYPFIFSASSF